MVGRASDPRVRVEVAERIAPRVVRCSDAWRLKAAKYRLGKLSHGLSALDWRMDPM
jgi:hypothetical protein